MLMTIYQRRLYTKENGRDACGFCCSCWGLAGSGKPDSRGEADNGFCGQGVGVVAGHARWEQSEVLVTPGVSVVAVLIGLADGGWVNIVVGRR